MKNLRKIRGFLTTIVIAATFFGAVISLTHFNPSSSVRGLLATLANASAFLLMCSLIIDDLYEPEEEKKENNKKEVRASSEAVSAKDRLQLEFSRLVSEIVWHNARNDGKLRLQMIKEGGTEEKILISPEDMEKAFLEAAKLVTEKCALDRCPCKTNCDKQTILQKIQNIRKNFEKISQTP